MFKLNSKAKAPTPSEAEALILSYQFDPSVLDRACKEYPKLIPVRKEVEDGLRQWFIACAWRGKNEVVDMPSMSVDWVWHSFILHTAQYVRFCNTVYGGYLHHHPVTVAGGIEVPMTPSREVYARSNAGRARPNEALALFELDRIIKVHHGMSMTEQTATCFVDPVDPKLVGSF